MNKYTPEMRLAYHTILEHIRLARIGMEDINKLESERSRNLSIAITEMENSELRFQYDMQTKGVNSGDFSGDMAL